MEESFRAAVTLLGATGDPTPLDGDQSEFARDKERICGDEQRDECQTGGRTNRTGPRRSRGRDIVAVRNRVQSPASHPVQPPGKKSGFFAKDGG